jgi:hypothetical protein
MPEERLLVEIIDTINHVLNRPSMYGTLYEAESFIKGLLAVAMSLESGEPLLDCQRRIYAAIRRLTEDVPGDRCWARRLSDAQLEPDRKTSDALFAERAKRLCAEMLACWKEKEGEELRDLLYGRTRR